MGVLARERLVKQPGESLLFAMDFEDLLESGETIATIVDVTATPTGLTISAKAIETDTLGVEFRIVGGTDGVSYQVTVKVITSAGNTREGDGHLALED